MQKKESITIIAHAHIDVNGFLLETTQLSPVALPPDSVLRTIVAFIWFTMEPASRASAPESSCSGGRL
jgi:hypothetical protein